MHKATPLSRARWAYLKSLPANTARMVFISAPLIRGIHPITNQPFVRAVKRDRRYPEGPANLPGNTYNAGRNAAKRARRAADRAAIAAAARSARHA